MSVLTICITVLVMANVHVLYMRIAVLWVGGRDSCLGSFLSPFLLAVWRGVRSVATANCLQTVRTVWGGGLGIERATLRGICVFIESKQPPL